MNIIMTYYDAIIQAQLKLQTIGYDELLKLSMGFDTDTTSNRLTDNTTNQKTDNKTNDIGNTNGINTTTFNSVDNRVYGGIDTFNQNTTTTTTQTKDGETITLNADTPQSAIEFDLQNKSQWSNSPFISDGNLNKTNAGEQKTINSGNNTNEKSGTDTFEKRGNDKTEFNTDTTNNNIFDGMQNTDFSGNENTITKTKYNNFDMMTTYKKIVDSIQSIENLICNDLKILFLQIY